MHCVRCGEKINKNVKFCRNCGTKIAPRLEVSLQRESLSPLPASSNKRLINLIVDDVCAWVFVFIFLSLLQVIGVSNQVWIYAGFLFYYFLMEAFWGKTVGKFITGTKVVDANGMKPKWTRILGRTLCRYIPFDAFSFFGKTPRGWHDSISNTFVVENKT